jgi:hypothetical protein
MSVDFNKPLTTRFLLLSYKYRRNIKKNNGAVVVVIVWLFDLQLPVQSVPITTKVESSNPIHGELYSMQNYVNKVGQWLATGRWFYLVSSTNNTDRHDITEILLKVT